jgi:hypothetical protein
MSKVGRKIISHIYPNYARITITDFKNYEKIPSDVDDVIARLDGIPKEISMSPAIPSFLSYVENSGNVYEGRIINFDNKTATIIVDDGDNLQKVTTKYDTVVESIESRYSHINLSEDSVDLSYTTNKITWNPILYIDLNADSNYGENFKGKVTLMGKIKVEDWRDFLIHNDDLQDEKGLVTDITLVETSSARDFHTPKPRAMAMVRSVSNENTTTNEEDVENEIIYPIGEKELKGCCIQTILQSKDISADIYHVVNISSSNASRQLMFKSPFYSGGSRQILKVNNGTKSYEVVRDGSETQANERVVFPLGMSDRIYSTISRKDQDKHSDIEVTINNRQAKSDKKSTNVIVTMPRYLSPRNITPKPNWVMGSNLVAWKITMKPNESPHKMNISFDF